MKTLFSVIKETEYSLFYNKDIYTKNEVLELPVEDIIYNSQSALPKRMFFCLVGSKADGHNFACDAYEKNVRIFVCERVLPLPEDAVQIVVEDTRIALAQMSACFFGHPEKKLKIIGVTGTKGKSSVCEMIYHIFSSLNIAAATIGTIGIKYFGKTIPTENSTPESYIIFKHFYKMVEAGIQYVAMEVSSQAVYLKRIYGLNFSAAVVTNIFEDHIGPSEHPSFDHYKGCKKQVLSATEKIFLNSDDIYYSEFFSQSAKNVLSFGIEKNADIKACNIENFKVRNIFGLSFECYCGDEKSEITLPLPGIYSVYNALAAISVCVNFGVSIFDCSKALKNISIPGRFEIVPTALPRVTCVIDYAHNGKSLMHVLETIREYTHNRIICVFGSVGGRTKNRRKEMALVANSIADICIITSDNPDTEDPLEIAEEIAQYISSEKCIIEIDRKKAIYCAVEMAESGDFILLAGKGHEEYQLINNKKIFFSEKEILKKAALAAKKKVILQ